MSEKQLFAREKFLEGYNCAQAVASAFADELKTDEKTVLKATSAFGGGFARSRNVCGAVSAMGFVIGLVRESNPDPRADKAEVYGEVGELCDLFKEKFGTILCGELLKNAKNVTVGRTPQTRDEKYYAERPCLAFIEYAVSLLETRTIRRTPTDNRSLR